MRGHTCGKAGVIPGFELDLSTWMTLPWPCLYYPWLTTVYLECSLVPMSLPELSPFDDMFLEVDSSPELDFLAYCPAGEQYSVMVGIATGNWESS